MKAGRLRGIGKQAQGQDFSPSLSSLFLNAAPRISPSDAPASEEPYCSTASFASVISLDLMETPSRLP